MPGLLDVPRMADPLPMVRLFALLCIVLGLDAAAESWKPEPYDLLPPPLLFGTLKTEVGRFVEFEVTSGGWTGKVRAALVAKTETDKGPVYQLEVHGQSPDILLVYWLKPREVGFNVERIASRLFGETGPVPFPAGFVTADPKLRGTSAVTRLTVPFRLGKQTGTGREETFTVDGKKAVVVLSDDIPLFGVVSVDFNHTLYRATATGTGAVPELKSLPPHVPVPACTAPPSMKGGLAP